MFGTLATFQKGGDVWKRWNGALKDVVLENQDRGDELGGSWAPTGPSSRALGRAGTTALMTLCLEVYYRYFKVYGATR